MNIFGESFFLCPVPSSVLSLSVMAQWAECSADCSAMMAAR